jgi:hypothetical protein
MTLFSLKFNIKFVFEKILYDLDPDSHTLSQLDPDPHALKKLDPDPHKVNADLKHCLWCCGVELLFV